MDNEVVLQKVGLENGYLIFNVKSIGVNVKRGGKGNETTAWVSLEMPTDRALPVAVPTDEATEQPENTLSLDEIYATFAALLAQTEKALAGAE